MRDALRRVRQRSPRPFADRRAAGRELGERLREHVIPDAVVLGLARGGVPVAYEVARALHAPLEVCLVRKIGAPGNPEFGIGAIAEGDVRVFNEDALRAMMISVEELDGAVARARVELADRVQRYRGGRAMVDIAGRTAIIVDDGLATGGSARAALIAVRQRGARRIILAVPVGAEDSVTALAADADEVLCLRQPRPFRAVGLWYEHFEPTTDAEIIRLLSAADVGFRGDGGADGSGVADPVPPLIVAPMEVRIPAEHERELVAELLVPDPARGLVVFAHGSGSSRHSPRNRFVGRTLAERGFATLLPDLLTVQEERERSNVFDIDLLSRRLIGVTRWAQHEPTVSALPIGYFGASTGAAAALQAAATLGGDIKAIVSRGGRPDLASAHLAEVRAPVLLLVGGDDELVLELNRGSGRRIGGPVTLTVVPGAGHLFEEPGALGEVARLAVGWFDRHLQPPDVRTPA